MNQVDPNACDELLARQGGFEAAYKKLVLYAEWTRANYASDGAAQVAMYQLDAEEVVNAAFERLFTEGLEPGEDIYHALRRYVQNSLHSRAKSKTDARFIRTDASEALTELYNQQDDPTVCSAQDKLILREDSEFLKRVISRVAADCKADAPVATLCEAVMAGFHDLSDLKEYSELNGNEFDAAFKRLKRRFARCLKETKSETYA